MLLGYCFKPFANSEKESLNSGLGGSLSKLKGEKLSLVQKKTHLGHEVGSNQLHSPRDSRAPCFGTCGPDLSLLPCSIIHIPRCDLHCMAEITGQLTRTDSMASME